MMAAMSVPIWLFFGWLGQAAAQPWPHAAAAQSLAEAIPPPAGYSRTREAEGSFGQWLRRLPLKPADAPVRLFDGRLKGNQSAHTRVIDLDVGKKDHQQCADAAMRLRAEYLFSLAKHDAICFRATNGTPVAWRDWMAGLRPRVAGRKIEWSKAAAADRSWATFRQYLDFLFVYAGTYSLAKESLPVAAAEPVQPGDVFIQGGFPGHAVIVLDVAVDPQQQRVFLLGQSYMPAQDIHVLHAQKGGLDPWYRFPVGDMLVTPEWTFAPARRVRFRDTGCGPLR
jgi:hypothetical protein